MRRTATIRTASERGGVSLQVLVLMVPVFFGLMGFAVDLGRLYMARGELQTAAQAMALAAASRLIGTEAATTDAQDAANRMVENESGFANRYDYGALTVGETNGSLNSEIVEPAYFATAAEAIGEDASAAGSGEVGGTEARHVRVELVGETPLLFWRFLSLGQEGKVPVRVRAVAGVSAPLCTACNIEPIALAALDAADTVDFGFVVGTRYTLGYSCTGNPIPQPLAGSTQRVPYLILNRANDQLAVYADDSQQLYRVGAQGLLASTTQALACFSVNAEESIWASAAPLACNVNRVNTAITSYLCGMATRMDPSLAQGCTDIPEVDTLTALYQSDSDLTDLEDYTTYAGNGRRLLTIPIVDALNPTGTMIVQGFRQFLLQPLQNQAGIASQDPNGRFMATYLGTRFPIKQGRFGDCAITNGPGKVVLHR
ncbi:MAG: hypothetical protein JNK48_00800 [Bryobacterales bacterium]|nr:hypothetical protein [Bryobacterales bacterium]